MRELLDDERFGGGDVVTPSRLPARATEGALRKSQVASCGERPGC